MGDVKPWLWGKNPCFATFVLFALSHPTSSNLLMLQLVVEAIIAFGGGCGRTVSPLPTCPLHPRLPILLPHAPIHGQLTLPRFLVCWLLTHRLWVILVSRRHFLPLHELLNTQALAICILLTAVHSHAENFPPVSHFHAQGFPGFYPRCFPLRIGEWSG